MKSSKVDFKLLTKGNKRGKIQRASAGRICKGPKAKGKKAYVSTTYREAIIPARQRRFVVKFFFIKLYLGFFIWKCLPKTFHVGKSITKTPRVCQSFFHVFQEKALLHHIVDFLRETAIKNEARLCVFRYRGLLRVATFP